MLPRPSALFAILFAALIAGASPGCGEREAAQAAGSASEAAARPATADAHAGHRHADERPLPAFSGPTLDGGTLSISSLIGSRLLLFFFNPEVPEAATVAEAVGRIAPLAGRHNFKPVGIAVGSTGDGARSFAQRHGLDFPIIDDSSGRITARIGLRQKVLVLGADAEGYMSFGAGFFPTEAPDAADLVEKDLREKLRLPAQAPRGGLLARPLAPDFETPHMDGNGSFRLSELAGKPVVLIFFLHTCPHCHDALAFLKKTLPTLPEDKRPELVGISIQDRPSAVRAELRSQELDYFPVLRDPGSEVQNLYGSFSGVPDLVLIDREGRVAHRDHGWRDRDGPLLRMRLARLGGAPVPMLLAKQGYTGNDVCGVCHELELRTWELTQHSGAYGTLVEHGAERDAECVSCHVVGLDQPGGFTLADQQAHLEGVGCESCHGRGGPHLSPDFVADGNYEDACRTCHNPTHSLGFEYASFRPKISHTAIAALSDEQRAEMLASHGKVRDVLPTAAAHVGSDACQSCHSAEYATWAAGPHARAVDTLRSQDKHTESDCLACHTTAFGKPGGFPSDALPDAHPDLARVGCESCHGPGGDHVPADATKLGSIVSLGDKCDSCVILQICGSCHDEVNDPGFEFHVEERIEAQRHGTIEAGTGKPLGESAGFRPDALSTGLALALGKPGASADDG